MTKRDFYKELYFSHNIDMENGNDIDTIDYHSLIFVITELCDRIEKLEERLDELDPPVNDVFGPTGLIGDPQ